MHFPGITYFPGAFHFNAGLCVDFFFLLSGFVIAHSTRNGLKTGSEMFRFMVRRVGRLWPLHVTILGILVLCKLESTLVIWLTHSDHIIPFQTASYKPYTIFTNMLMLQGFDTNGWSWNFPSWSISVEFWVYGLFAVLIWTTGPWARFWGICLVIAAIGLQWMLMGAGNDAFPGGVLRCIAGFFTGYLVYSLFTSVDMPKVFRRTGTFAEVAAVLLIAGAMGVMGGGLWLLAVPLILAAPLWIFACQKGAVSRLLKGRVCQALGTWSYGIYLVHLPVIIICNHWWALAQVAAMKAYGSQCAVGYANAKVASPHDCGVADVAVLIVMTGLYLVVVLKVAQLSYRFIEAPARRRFNVWADLLGK